MWRRGRVCFSLVVILTACFAGTTSLRITKLKIPEHVEAPEPVKMECDYDLDQERLYSVKWYKDGHEFYRYVPEERPAVQLFTVDGVSVNKKNSTEREIELSTVSQNSSGLYRCEVSAEAPSFFTVSDHAKMTVVVLPDRGPTISGGKSKYQVGDLVRVNCTSAPSKPPAMLTWHVNDAEVDKRYLRGPTTLSVKGSDLKVTRLGLEFNVTSQLFRYPDVRLKCLATISTMYKSSHYLKISSDDERFLKQPMETRAQSHARSDPTNGSKTITISLAMLLVFCMSFHR